MMSCAFRLVFIRPFLVSLPFNRCKLVNLAWNREVGISGQASAFLGPRLSEIVASSLQITVFKCILCIIKVLSCKYSTC